MEDFIDPEWVDAVSVSYNKTVDDAAARIVKKAEELVYNYGHQWRADIAGKTAILLQPGEGYEWHFDNLDYAKQVLTTARGKRFWTHIIYLTYGKPLEIGNWNPDGERVQQTDFSAPEPNKVLARIHPKPGKSVIFPSFMVHRIQPLVDNRRWAFVEFVESADYKDKSKRDLKLIFNRYFDEHTRSKLLPSR